MDNLQYSNDALEVISDFYNCELTIYVEGEDDVIFWDNIFKLSDKQFHIEDAGGIEELKKYIKKIEEENVDIYVAKDNDYCDFFENQISNERIFSTYGHSIENTLYSINSIKNIIKNFSRLKGADLPEAIDIELNSIIEDFKQKIKPVLIYEIANDVYNKGVSVLGINTCKFLTSNNSVNLCETKINNFIEQNIAKFQVEEIELISAKLDENPKSIWNLVRGHFLTNFVANLIKKLVKKLSLKNINLPIDVIYPLFIDINLLKNSDDINHYNYA